VRVMKNRPALLSSGLIAMCGLLALVPSAGAAKDSLDRLIGEVAAYAPTPDAARLRRDCGLNLHCAAEKIADHLGPKAYLRRVAPPDTDIIRMVDTTASLGTVRDLPDRRLVVLNRFGRKVEADLVQALNPGMDILLDLRGNAGGDFGRMLRVAGLLIGPREKALSLTHKSITKSLDLPNLTTGVRPRTITVLVGPETASSAEVLAALLHRYGRAEILGARTAGKDYLLRVIPVDQNWRLLVPAERILVPGETLAGGLAPDRALTPALQAALSL